MVALNTVLPHKHVDGRVSNQQIDWVSSQLKSAPTSALKVVVAHHPFAVVLQDDKNNLISGASRAVDQWSRVGLDLILGGHIHFPFFAPLNTHFNDLKTTTDYFYISQKQKIFITSKQASLFLPYNENKPVN